MEGRMPFSLARELPLRTGFRARTVLPDAAPSNRQYLAGGLWAPALLQPGLKHKQLAGRMSTKILPQATNGASPWETLGVERTADKQTIRRAYRKLALKSHPDLNDSPDAPHQFVAIHEAYELLIGRSRGKESDGQHWSRAGWDFHDWYWNFMTRRRQSAKRWRTARASTQPLQTDHLADQLAGLKRKAACRRANMRPSSNTSSQEAGLGQQAAAATSSSRREHEGTASAEPTATTTSASSQDQPCNPRGHDQHAANYTFRQQDDAESSATQSWHFRHAEGQVHGHQLHASQWGAAAGKAADDFTHGSMASDDCPSERRRQPLHKDGVLGCVQEFLSNAVALHSRLSVPREWAGKIHLQDWQPSQQGMCHGQQQDDESGEGGCVATMARPEHIPRHTIFEPAMLDEESKSKAAEPKPGSEMAADTEDLERPSGLENQLAGLRRRAAMRKNAEYC